VFLQRDLILSGSTATAAAGENLLYSNQRLPRSRKNHSLVLVFVVTAVQVLGESGVIVDAKQEEEEEEWVTEDEDDRFG
jgi:hypothetical protein